MSGNQGYDVVVDVDDAEVTKYQESEAIKEANRYKQGDLGHTDLQEDLEFHSSSKSSITTKIAYPIRASHPYILILNHTNTTRSPSIRTKPPFQDPTRHNLNHDKPLLQPLGNHSLKALPLVPPLLRAILRRRHKRCHNPMLGSSLPATPLPRCPRWEPGFIRSILDSNNSGVHIIPRRLYKSVSASDGGDG